MVGVALGLAVEEIIIDGKRFIRMLGEVVLEGITVGIEVGAD